MKNTVVKLEGQGLKGAVVIPPSKSLAHRYIIGASLADGVSTLSNIDLSVDISATLECFKGLGVEVSFRDEDLGRKTVIIKGLGENIHLSNGSFFDCRESGSTLRFLIPILLLLEDEITVTGEGKLKERPLDVYYKIFKEQGIFFKNTEGNLPLTFKGPLKGGQFSLRGDVSSQFITGLMLALPLVAGNSVLELTSTLESKPYVDLTVDILKKYGIKIEEQGTKPYYSFKIPGEQKYQKGDFKVEGDFSQVAFFAVAGLIGQSPIEVRGLNKKSLQGDKVILDICSSMGGRIEELDDGYLFYPSKTKGITIDVQECPDLVPALALLGALSQGETRIINGARLRIKESDRLKAISTELNVLGAEIKETEDGLIIQGVEKLRGGQVQSWNDHRIAMTLAVASIVTRGAVILTGAESVNKSYPDFWEDFKKLGGSVINE